VHWAGPDDFDAALNAALDTYDAECAEDEPGDGDLTAAPEPSSVEAGSSPCCTATVWRGSTHERGHRQR
jgi:hypothetical protein